jgi:hypothetical protein
MTLDDACTNLNHAIRVLWLDLLDVFERKVLRRIGSGSSVPDLEIVPPPPTDDDYPGGSS